MGRPHKFSQALSLTQIRDAFWQKGYEATSLNDLVEITGLNRGSLYTKFGNKQAMFYKALAEYEAKYVSVTAQKMRAISGKKALAFLLSAPSQSVIQGDRRGCFLCNTTSETQQLDDETQALAARSRETLHGAIAEGLSHFGPYKVDINMRETKARELLSLYFGLRVLARGGESAANLDTVAQSALKVL